MVIQRWQTLWLLVAAVLVGVFCFVPMALVSTVEAVPDSVTWLYPSSMPVFLTVNVLTALLLLLAIFMFRNMNRQKTVILVSMLLMLVSGASEAIVLCGWDESAGKVEWLGSIFLLAGAFAFAWLAYRSIVSDEKLLKAADRLR